MFDRERPSYAEFLEMDKNQLLSLLDGAYRDIDKMLPFVKVYNTIRLNISNRVDNGGYVINRQFVSEEEIMNNMEEYYLKGLHFKTLLDYIQKNETLKDEWDTLVTTLALVQLADEQN